MASSSETSNHSRPRPPEALLWASRAWARRASAQPCPGKVASTRMRKLRPASKFLARASTFAARPIFRAVPSPS
eukprot:2923901-Alexandrium_andersonii.AAC.1